jgi:hypothetical protein
MSFELFVNFFFKKKTKTKNEKQENKDFNQHGLKNDKTK